MRAAQVGFMSENWAPKQKPVTETTMLDTSEDRLEQFVDTPEGTVKLKIIHDREWDEWQVRTFRRDGGQIIYKDMGDDRMYPASDKEDALMTMNHMADKLREKYHGKTDAFDARQPPRSYDLTDYHDR